jgi:DNA-binding transcriptional regulator of glucitol operon
VLVTVAALGCMGLAWWQWSRFQSLTGSFQNLGYALQWPMFGIFCFYAYYKFVRYEEAPPEPTEKITEIPEGLLPERPKAASDADPEMVEYNKYLSDLAQHDLAPHDNEDRTTT